MPEYPDVVVYLERLQAYVGGRVLEGVRLRSPFVLRSVDPPLASVFDKRVEGFERIGKRLVWVFPDELFLVIHLMVAGRLHWKKRGTAPAGKVGLAAFDFDNGSLMLTEASMKKRASINVVQGRGALQALDRGGIDVFTSSTEEFAAALTRENHTLKRTLTDPRMFDGIGNAYSDEILHRAKLSPLTFSTRLDAAEVQRLQAACRDVLAEWTTRLRAEAGDGFPEKVTAFRPEMAVHGKYREPCPVCGARVQRIRYADNETNYCATCQTGGKLLADRAVSRLLKEDWPKTLDELEEQREVRRQKFERKDV
jgi:formamidopyrimidine-DNA glycosylase